MADDGRRYPANLRGLLAFCTEHTKVEDAPGESVAIEMNDERRKWLNEAIEAMQGTDPLKVMLQDIQVLVNAENSEDDVEKKEQALEDLQLHTEDIDLANDFHKIGGFHLLPSLLQSKHAGYRWRTAVLVATLTQNNPYCQQEILNMQLMPMLLKLVDDSTEDELVRVKALYALSCLTRESEQALKEFIKHDGVSVLLRAMQTDVDKLQIKSAFLMSNLCQQQPMLKDVLCNVGIVEQLVGLLSTEHRNFHEHLVSALFYIITDSEHAQLECRRPEFHFESLLRQRREFLQSKEEYQEELQFVCRLYDLCFQEQSNIHCDADR